jgi:hypothetical protein
MRDRISVSPCVEGRECNGLPMMVLIDGERPPDVELPLAALEEVLRLPKAAVDFKRTFGQTPTRSGCD